MKPYFTALLLFATSLASAQYVCTARSSLGKAYHAVGVDQELTMLDALKQCEAGHFRCFRGGCRQTSISTPIQTRYNIGDTVANMCWPDENNQSICLDDLNGQAKVLIYNAGWCGPCNSELSAISQRFNEMQGKNVAFLSLSGAGWSQGSRPDSRFLQQWKQQHSIPFAVLGSAGDYGGKFGHSAIPNVAILDANNRVTYTDTAPGVDVIFEEALKAMR